MYLQIDSERMKQGYLGFIQPGSNWLVQSTKLVVDSSGMGGEASSVREDQVFGI